MYKKHGRYGTPEYRVWDCIIQRCCNSNAQAYKDYGGRGIKVCDEWRNSFSVFFNDMGKKPGSEYTIERVNNDGNYESGNCKWILAKEQNGNRRNNRLFKAVSPIGREYINRNQSEFARSFNLSNVQICYCLNQHQRSHKGWTFERME